MITKKLLKPELDFLEKVVLQTRRDILRMVYLAQSGHPGGALGCTEFMVLLYHQIMMMNDTFDIDGKNEDIFFLSNGHISPVYYSVLARKKFFPVEELNTFRKINSRLQGHPTTHEGLPGVRVATGSLGQGLSVAIGASLSKKLNHDNHLVYCLLGDGELQEGQNWEAFMFASGKKVDNLIAIIDLNGQQIDGATHDVLPLGDLTEKISAFGWKVIEIKEGNKIMPIMSGMKKAKENTGEGKPVCVLLHTTMGNGVPFMMHDHTWHGKAPNKEQLHTALAMNPETIGDF